MAGPRLFARGVLLTERSGRVRLDKRSEIHLGKGHHRQGQGGRSLYSLHSTTDGLNEPDVGVCHRAPRWIDAMPHRSDVNRHATHDVVREGSAALSDERAHVLPERLEPDRRTIEGLLACHLDCVGQVSGRIDQKISSGSRRRSMKEHQRLCCFEPVEERDRVVHHH